MTAALLSAGSARAGAQVYLDIDRWQPIEAYNPLGPEGVPRVTYAWGVEDNPVTVSQWGLQHWTWWLQTGADEDLERAVRGADWLVEHQRDDGAWEYQFDFAGAGVHLTAPWISGMAQGQAISLLVRLHGLTGDARYRDAAIGAVEPFERSFVDGGVRADFDGAPWYEEYPTADPQHVLNGFQFALVGLHDVAPHAPQGLALFDAGVASLVARIGVFDAPAARSQYYAARGAGRVLVSGSYPRIHAVLTRELYRLSGERTFLDYAARWERYLVPVPRPPTPPPAAPPALPPPLPESRASPCTFRGKAVHLRGPVSCEQAREVVRRYLRRQRVRPWRCRMGSRVTCRRGRMLVSAPRAQRRSAPRYAPSSSSALRAHV